MRRFQPCETSIPPCRQIPFDSRHRGRDADIAVSQSPVFGTGSNDQSRHDECRTNQPKRESERLIGPVAGQRTGGHTDPRLQSSNRDEEAHRNEDDGGKQGATSREHENWSETCKQEQQNVRPPGETSIRCGHQDHASGVDDDGDANRNSQLTSPYRTHAETSIPPCRQIPFDSGHRGRVAVSRGRREPNRGSKTN